MNNRVDLGSRRRFLRLVGMTAALPIVTTSNSRAEAEQVAFKDEPHATGKAVDFEPGGYRYVPDVFQYSGGVASLPGFTMERVRLRKLLTLDQGYKFIEDHLKSIGRPTTAICSIELRSPKPFTEEGFRAFNKVYVQTLEGWGLYKDGKNPVARNNVCPEKDKPDVTRLHAFTYTVEAKANEGGSFQIAGSAEEPESLPQPWSHIIAPGDTSPAGIAAKAKWVIAEMQSRLDALQLEWSNANATDIYTVHDISPLMGTELVACGASKAGVTWHYARPPVDNVDFEMGIRGIAHEAMI